MRYCIGDKFVLQGIESTVRFINSSGHAYIVPDNDGEVYNNEYTAKGLVFAILDAKGKDKLGNKALTIVRQDCGAV